ncbi:hypothetical protein VNO80_02703 [Phaseolus coccineus]|uniref:Uncharacterized protein n=1 Tax=Phaseolus coccineus TaxID=3886 RepID=A0AAN9NQE3_PHACN
MGMLWKCEKPKGVWSLKVLVCVVLRFAYSYCILQKVSIGRRVVIVSVCFWSGALVFASTSLCFKSSLKGFESIGDSQTLICQFAQVIFYVCGKNRLFGGIQGQIQGKGQDMYVDM